MTKSIHTRILVTMLLPLWAAACASTPPTKQLVDARKAYQEARQGQAAKLKPDEMVDAHEALKAAEKAHQEDPGSVEEQHLAYLAGRRARLAMTHAQEVALTEEYEQTQAEAQSRLKSYAFETKQELAQARRTLFDKESRLQETQEHLVKERQARKEAEALAAKAMRDLKEIATVKEESRGVVITLSGAVLFKSGQSDLLETAQEKLEDVARVLKDEQVGPEATIVVEGHTDSRGSESYNQKLSLARAESVRSHLVSQGIDTDRIKAVGKGESAPLAPNDTPEGRANNRRVEIVINEDPTAGARSATASGAGQ